MEVAASKIRSVLHLSGAGSDVGSGVGSGSGLGCGFGIGFLDGLGFGSGLVVGSADVSLTPLRGKIQRVLFLEYDTNKSCRNQSVVSVWSLTVDGLDSLFVIVW